MITTSLYILRDRSGSLRILTREPRYDVANEVYTWILSKSVHEYFRRILPETGIVEFLLHPRDYAAIYTPSALYCPSPKRKAQLKYEKESGLPIRFFIEKKSEGEFHMSIADPVHGCHALHLDSKDKENWVWLPSKWSPYFKDLMIAHGAIEYKLSSLGAEQIIETEEKIAKGLLN